MKRRTVIILSKNKKNVVEIKRIILYYLKIVILYFKYGCLKFVIFIQEIERR